MNYRILIIISLFLYSCTTTDVAKKDPIEFIQGKIYSNKGFALLYNEDLKKQKLVSKKIEDRTLIIFQSNLKKNTDVKITNLLNNKSILAKVGANSKYPKIKIREIAIIAGSINKINNEPVAPCGSCRQVISEYQTNQNADIGLYFMAEKGKIIYTDSINNLLPFKFDKSFL